MIMTWMDRDSEAKQGSMQIIRKVDDDFFFYMLYVKCFDSSNKIGFTLRMIILLYNQPENERQEFVRHRSIKTTLTMTLFKKNIS